MSSIDSVEQQLPNLYYRQSCGDGRVVKSAGFGFRPLVRYGNSGQSLKFSIPYLLYL